MGALEQGGRGLWVDRVMQAEESEPWGEMKSQTVHTQLQAQLLKGVELQRGCPTSLHSSPLACQMGIMTVPRSKGCTED